MALGMWLFCAALIVIVFAAGILDRQKTWTDMPYTLLQFEDGLERSGAQHGVMNDGPNLNLPAGTYRLKWGIEGDGNNRLLITTKSGVQAEPAQIAISDENAWGETMFTLPSAAQGVDIQVSYDSGTTIRVADMRLYSPMYRDHASPLRCWRWHCACLLRWLCAARSHLHAGES